MIIYVGFRHFTKFWENILPQNIIHCILWFRNHQEIPIIWKKKLEILVAIDHAFYCIRNLRSEFSFYFDFHFFIIVLKKISGFKIFILQIYFLKQEVKIYLMNSRFTKSHHFSYLPFSYTSVKKRMQKVLIEILGTFIS